MTTPTPPTPEAKQPGALIGGRYRLEERLGRGGMAEVYKAYQESLDRHVAIKFMHGFLAEDPQFRQRFQREARSVAALHHPNIVQVIDYDWAEGSAYMVMEFIDGPTLDARLAELAAEGRGERLPLAEAVRIVRDAALALSYAHARHIVHRDIKPANIMLEKHGRVILTDFGLAKLLSAARVTATGAIMGTPAYMAPEQVLGQAGDKRVDIYALGILLYELVTGQRPFLADSPIALALMHLNQTAALPRTLNPNLPEGLEQVILKALAKQPEARFQSADELAAHLDYFLSPTGNAAPPSLASLAAEPSLNLRPLPPHNLPAQPTSFIGRQQELAEVCARLRQPEARLVTLTGPGGAGKTRLSLQTASTLLTEFADGVFFVPMAEIREPELVIAAIAQALGVKEDERALLDHLKSHIQPRQVLLVLDNFEQVLDAAPLVTELLVASPGLKVLTTSRAALRVYGEYEFPVPPLAVPDLDQLTSPAADSAQVADLARYTAISLFAERAQAVRPNFSLTRDNALTVAQICAKLDGLPLAIELVAPRIKLLSLAAILNGLDNRLKLLTGGARDLPARQRTLRGAIDWGYNLLEEDERILLARLAVFSGGFTLESAEAVLGAHPVNPEYSILDGLTVMVDNSLLRQTDGVRQSETAHDEPRFIMLETIREYALEKLREAAGGELARYQTLHATHYLTLAEAAAPQLQGREQIAALNLFEAEHHNLIAALAGAISRRSLPTVLRLGSALWRFWLLRGYLSEGLKWLDAIRALAAEHESPDPVPLARALYGVAALHNERGDTATASAVFQESLALFKQAGATNGAAYAQNDLGASLLAQRRADEATALCEASLSTFKHMGDEWGMASALTNLGLAALSRGDAARATQLCQESFSLFQKLGDRWGMALALNNLGLAALPQGDDERASTLVQSGLSLMRELGGR